MKRDRSFVIVEPGTLSPDEWTLRLWDGNQVIVQVGMTLDEMRDLAETASVMVRLAERSAKFAPKGRT